MAVSTTLASLRSESSAGRFELVRELGEGATGAVYLATDSETGEQVALKRLFRVDQKSVLRFKREFRALADLHHPSLVKLYELLHDSDDAWFLTMEYVDGVDLRTRLLGSRDVLATREENLLGSGGQVPALGLLLHCFLQLAEGVQAVHRAGLLHRDLKPSNVLVAQNDRVVVLDFGLIRELSEPALQLTQDDTVAGTPAYMPPEQALGQTLSEASDWYAFGVMLYEVLSGRLPVDARNAQKLLELKLSREPQSLSPVRLGVPPELTQLCMQLLQRDPERRPDGAEVLDVLRQLRGVPVPRERTHTEELSLPADGPKTSRPPLFGREPEQLQLRAAFERVRKAGSLAVHVRGSSGAGKSALIEHFLEEAERPNQGALVLRSRCYEREAMPFKALDGLMDALVSHLSKLDDLEVAHLLPHAISELTQLFPVFQRLRAVQRLIFEAKPLMLGPQARRRAEQSLHELIERVARKHPLVIWIDDLQWGDLDSASVLREWLLRPVAAPLLFVLSYRSEEVATSACLRTLLAQPAAAEIAHDPTTLELPPLADHHVAALCRQRLGDDSASGVISRIVTEAGGNAFLVLQLAGLAQAMRTRGEHDLDALSVGELVLRTSALLPAPARELLHVLAVAGRPLLPHLALRAAEVGRDGRALIHALQGLRLVRSRVVGGERLLEIYHDRVREAVQSALDQRERAQLHDRLLQVLEISGRADPDWLHELALGAEQPVPALRYGILAAERAHATLAFEREAELYARCLKLTDVQAQRAQLWSKLARALARGRRGAEAADAYLEAARLAQPSEQLPLLQQAASHLLRTGRFEEGERLVQQVLAAQDISAPESDTGLYASIAWEHLQLGLRGQNFTRRAASELPPDALRRAVLFATLAVETQTYAPLRAAWFQARALRSALQLGEPASVGRAYCIAATLSCVSGTAQAERRATEQLARAEQLLEECQSHDLRAEFWSARTICAYMLGDMPAALYASGAADQSYGAQRAGGDHGDYYYYFSVHTARIGTLQVLGRHTQANAELREFLTRAHVTGNRTAVLQAALVTTFSDQTLGQNAGARARLDAEAEQLPARGFGVLHALHLAAVMWSACAAGEFAWGRATMDKYWQRYMSSPLRRSPVLAFILHSTRARMLLNEFVVKVDRGSGRGTRSEDDPAALVREDLRALQRLSGPGPRSPGCGRVEARLAFLRGDTQRAASILRENWQRSRELDHLEEAERDRLALGYVLGGNEGAQLRAAAIASSRELGVADPLAMLRSTYPEVVSD